jgi:peroxiredoxin
MNELLPTGVKAPDFRLPSSAPVAAGEGGETISLHDYAGKNVILVFYPADWSAVCGDELAVYNEILPMFQKLNAEMLGISVDSVFCHQAFKENRGFKMSLLADFEPKGKVAKQYGVYRGNDGFSERALFVIDSGGVIRYSYVSPIGVNPGANEILKTLREIENKQGKAKNG